MILWTIQSYPAYLKLLENGYLNANEDYLFCKDDFCFAYDWISEKMCDLGLISFNDINYPIWAWYQWEGKRKCGDLREGGYAKLGEKMVKLTIEIPDNEIMLFDFDLFHYVLNYWYLPLDEADDDDFEKEYEALGYGWHDLQDLSIQEDRMNNIREKIKNSWNRIFDLEREDENCIFGKNSSKSIQATFWQLKLEQVIKVEIFFAK